MHLIRFGFFWLSVLSVLLGSLWGAFRGRRRIGQGRGTADRPEVILIRGAAMGVYPYWPGAEELADRFAVSGFATTIINHFEYPRVSREIVRAVRKGQLQGGVALVGYSFGADTASLLAELLEEQGIDVSSMVLIESTWGVPVPGNVALGVNYYKTRVMDFIPSSRGVAVAARRPRTQLTNINVREHAQFQEISRHSHFTIGGEPRLHQLVVDFIGTRRPPELTDARVAAPAGAVARAA
jgi:pimeloyl-ACP methyl ester carboxylesterase